jgi:hypothetical protein
MLTNKYSDSTKNKPYFQFLTTRGIICTLMTKLTNFKEYFYETW